MSSATWQDFRHPPFRSLRDALAEDEADREAERRARGETAVGVDVETPCARCGGPVRAKGAALDEAWRVHPECADDARVLRTLTGDKRVTAEEAAAVWEQVRGVPEYRRTRGALPGVPTAAGRRRVKELRAWSFLRDTDRDTLRSVLAEVRKPVKVRQPRRSGLGCCVWCGVGTSVTWHRVPGWKWADDSPCALCSSCVRGWRAAGRPHQVQRERWGGRVVALLVGADVHNSQVGWSALQPPVFCEQPGADRQGVAVGWSWVNPEARREARIATIGRQPGLAVDPAQGAVYAAEYRRRARQIASERRAEEEAARPVRW